MPKKLDPLEMVLHIKEAQLVQLKQEKIHHEKDLWNRVGKLFHRVDERSKEIQQLETEVAELRIKIQDEEGVLNTIENKVSSKIKDIGLFFKTNDSRTTKEKNHHIIENIREKNGFSFSTSKPLHH